MMYRGLIPRSKEKPTFQMHSMSQLRQLFEIVRISFNISTWLALGGVLQGLLIMLPIPRHYALAPSVLLLLFRIVQTGLESFGIIPNPYLKGAVPYRYSAIIPDEHGNFPSEGERPTKQKVAVLILCAKVNHPAGWFGAPHVPEFGQLFDKMHEDLKALPQEESGLLGQSQAFMPTADGQVEILNFSYWRSKEFIHKFAEGPSHRDAMKWWTEMGGYDGKGGKIPHMGIGHEIYESEPGHWESVYTGFQPTLLGNTAYLKKGDDLEKSSGSDEWISPIVDARRGKLASSRGRLGVPMTKDTDFGIQM